MPYNVTCRGCNPAATVWGGPHCDPATDAILLFGTPPGTTAEPAHNPYPATLLPENYALWILMKGRIA